MVPVKLVYFATLIGSRIAAKSIAQSIQSHLIQQERSDNTEHENKCCSKQEHAIYWADTNSQAGNAFYYLCVFMVNAKCNKPCTQGGIFVVILARNLSYFTFIRLLTGHHLRVARLSRPLIFKVLRKPSKINNIEAEQFITPRKSPGSCVRCQSALLLSHWVGVGCASNSGSDVTALVLCPRGGVRRVTLGSTGVFVATASPPRRRRLSRVPQRDSYSRYELLDLTAPPPGPCPRQQAQCDHSPSQGACRVTRAAVRGVWRGACRPSHKRVRDALMVCRRWCRTNG